MEQQVPMVSAAMAKVSPDKYILIDVREAGEPTEAPAALPKDVINVRTFFLWPQSHKGLQSLVGKFQTLFSLETTFLTLKEMLLHIMCALKQHMPSILLLRFMM